jgi:hypothetical protein
MPKTSISHSAIECLVCLPISHTQPPLPSRVRMGGCVGVSGIGRVDSVLNNNWLWECHPSPFTKNIYGGVARGVGQTGEGKTKKGGGVGWHVLWVSLCECGEQGDRMLLWKKFAQNVKSTNRYFVEFNNINFSLKMSKKWGFLRNFHLIAQILK